MGAANYLSDIMTSDQFLNWQPPPYHPSDRWQLIDGVPCLMAPSSPWHGAIQNRTAYLLTAYRDAHRPSCSSVTEPGVRPRVGATGNVRIPDFAVTCTPIGPDDKLLREPVVIVEVLSPSDRAETWTNVWSYVTIPSVRDIVVVYVVEMRIDLLRRNDDQTWPDDALVLMAGDTITLDSLGFTGPIEAFYR